MLRFAVSLTLILSFATAVPKQSFYSPIKSVASDSQIAFAIKNNYDDTGPGAKTPEYAYKTFRTLEEALPGYIDDKDTKLPEAERNMAIERLQREYGNNGYRKPAIVRYQPKTVDEYTGYNQAQKAQTMNSNSFYPVQAQNVPVNSVPNLEALLSPSDFKPANPVPRYDTPIASNEEMKKEYSYSYGVNDVNTGDQKSAQEYRQGGTVRGYYTLLDADGSTRTVKYMADKNGFHAVVDRKE